MSPSVECDSMMPADPGDSLLQLEPNPNMEIPEDLRAAIVAAVVAALANGHALPRDVNELGALCRLPEWLKAALSILCPLDHAEDEIFIRALLEHLDRKDNLIPFPVIGVVDRIRVRALRRRIGTALPVQGDAPLS